MRFLTGESSKRTHRPAIWRATRGRAVPTALATGLLVLALVALTGVAAGCGLGGEVGDAGAVSTTETTETTNSTVSTETTTTTAPARTTTTVAEDTMTVNVYYSTGEICAATRVIPKTEQVGAAAIQALLEGPTPQEEAAGMVTNIPEGTTFLGLAIEDGVATVDLSKEYASGGGSYSMIMRLAEVVFTLTQFPTVDGVNFKLDSEPVGVFGGEGFVLDHPLDRSEYVDLTPAVLVESPTVGTAVTSPIRITGTADVPGGVFLINLVDSDGLILAEEIVTTTSGAGARDAFDVTLPYSIDHAGQGSIIVFAESDTDGSQTDEIEIPLQLEK